jgi:hypothetical protein
MIEDTDVELMVITMEECGELIQVCSKAMRTKKYRSKKLTEQDINAHKRFQQLLQIHNSIDQKPLKRYLQSFRSN